MFPKEIRMLHIYLRPKLSLRSKYLFLLEDFSVIYTMNIKVCYNFKIWSYLLVQHVYTCYTAPWLFFVESGSKNEGFPVLRRSINLPFFQVQFTVPVFYYQKQIIKRDSVLDRIKCAVVCTNNIALIGSSTMFSVDNLPLPPLRHGKYNSKRIIIKKISVIP